MLSGDAAADACLMENVDAIANWKPEASFVFSQQTKN